MDAGNGHAPDNQMPEWAQSLFEKIASVIEYKGVAHTEGYHYGPDDTAWGVDLLELAPALMDLSEFGGEEGEEGYGIIHHFDLLATQDAFDEMLALGFGIENDGRPCITMEGKVDGRMVVVLVYTAPPEDEEDEPDEEP